jgi:hypothetical protein
MLAANAIVIPATGILKPNKPRFEIVEIKKK